MSAGFCSGRGQLTRRRSQRTAWWLWFMECYPAAITVFVGTMLALTLTGAMKHRLQPLLSAAAGIQTENRIVSVMEQTVLGEIERLDVAAADLVCVNRAKNGSITAITTDIKATNRLRSALIACLAPELAKIDQRDVAVPIGSLFESELLWGRGPTIKIRALSVGSLRAEFESEVTSERAGRTQYKIWLVLSAPTTVFLPDDRLEMEVRTCLCVAETVVAGDISSDV